MHRLTYLVTASAADESASAEKISDAAFSHCTGIASATSAADAVFSHCIGRRCSAGAVTKYCNAYFSANADSSAADAVAEYVSRCILCKKVLTS